MQAVRNGPCDGEMEAADGTRVTVRVGIGEAVGVAEPLSGTGESHKDTRNIRIGMTAKNFTQISG